MLKLLLVSIIWAFSFPLIGHRLRSVDPYFVAMVRMALSLAVFLPFYRWRTLPWKKQGQLLVCGALQYGVMYVCYLQSYQYLKSHEIALLTILTPIYTTLCFDVFSKRFHGVHFGAAILSVAGVAIIKYTAVSAQDVMIGIILVQTSNIAFAFGQVFYRCIMADYPALGNVTIFAPLYAGAFLLTLCVSLAKTPFTQLQVTPQQWSILLYLGIIASGVCFFLWNAGARQINAGALAIFNNLKIPLAMIVSVVFFGETAHWSRLIIGTAIALSALAMNEIYERKSTRV
ncbi:MAG: EamA family transporter [Spartobacteria bacterium]|nr:EamA family transporter [Spartobacteria bacterium]